MSEGNDQNIYEVTPHKTKQALGQNNIYNQYVKAGGLAQMNAQNQIDYNQQVQVSSYYLLHGKFNGKGAKQKSNSVKATDLG